MPPEATTANAQAAAADSDAPPRTTLLSLPDELLAQIFTDLHARLRDRKTGVPLHRYLQICKRLYTVARPIWLSVLVIPEQDADSFYACAIKHQEVLAYAREMTIGLEPEPPEWKIALLHRFTELRTLRFRQLGAEADSYVDADVCEAIDSLEDIESLHVLSANTKLWRIDPYCFEAIELPITSRILADGFASLTKLTLHIDGDHDVTTWLNPWETLAELEIVVDPQLSATPQVFLRTLLIQTASVRKFKFLQSLKVTLSHNSPANTDICKSLFGCFARASIRHLALDYGSYRSPDAEELPWKTLRKLTLRSTMHLGAPHRMQQFLAFFTALKSLEELILIDFDWIGYGRASLPQITRGNKDTVFGYATAPTLYTLIQLLREKTALSSVGVRLSSQLHLRWTRSSPKEDFQVARFVGYENRVTGA
ncbi:hypothetical protein JCM10908_006335 [Rhodotorula pacifica]|uniref:uncharacterized protein n=1 Tax=Rhodotorula pacifica TaxID=1495444 RepID=UPI003179C8F5